LTFDEILNSPLGWTVRKPERNIDVIDNTPEEIQAAVEEMFELLDSCSFDTLSHLQAEFNQLRDLYGRQASTPIAKFFISKYQKLLLKTISIEDKLLKSM
jgi:hypothetical protein